MTRLPLYGDKAAGRVALVDVTPDGRDAYEIAMRYRWNVWGPYAKAEGQKPIGPYAIATPRINGRQVTLRLHNLITGWPYVDHADGDGLNCQLYNLRQSDHTTNGQNRTKADGCASRYKGVTLMHAQSLRPWRARITVDGKVRYLGSFAEQVEAALAYDSAAQEAFGEFALLNFPVD